LGDEYRQERVLELEELRDEILATTHSPACPGWDGGCWCPLQSILDVVDDRLLDLQPDRYDK